MQVRTAKEIGALIRDERKKLKLDQAELADLVGVNRRWVLEVERGKPRAEVGLILKTLHALGLSILIEGENDTRVILPKPEIDIDMIIEKAKGGPK
ncbi:MAG: helix-turn-helix domain-containing protein [Rhizobiaceae bacterium]